MHIDRKSLPPYVKVIPPYEVRFIRPDQVQEITDLYRIARVALAGQECTRYTRMLYAAKEFHKAHPEVSQTAAYKDLDGLLQ